MKLERRMNGTLGGLGTWWQGGSIRDGFEQAFALVGFVLDLVERDMIGNM